MQRFDNRPRGSTCGVSFDDLSAFSDEDLLVHVGHRDGDAVAVLYQRYRRLVFSVGLQILRDEGEAEDVVQNVFVDIFRTTLRYDPARGTVKIWILQFAYHRSFRRRRQLHSRRFYTNVEISEVAESISGTSEAVATVENRHLLSKAMNDLGRSQRQVLELTCRDGLSLQDIAKATGEKIGNVRHHYYRGLQALRSRLRGGEETAMRGSRKEAGDAIT